MKLALSSITVAKIYGLAKIASTIDYCCNTPLWNQASIAQAMEAWFDYLMPQGNT